MLSRRMMVIGLADVAILLISIAFGLITAGAGMDMLTGAGAAKSLEWMVYIIVIMGSLTSMGMYNADYMFDMREAVTRLITGFLAAFVLVSILLGLVKTGQELNHALPLTMALSFAGLLIVRYAASQGVVSQFLKRRILVLGAGTKARRIEVEVRKKNGHCGFIPVAYIPTSPDESGVSLVNTIDDPVDLSAFCIEAGIDEIVIAADERRGNMPIDALLETRMSGCKITALTDFIEREAGQVELEGLYPSWLVFSGGNARNVIDRTAKQIVDIAASATLLVATLPILLITALLIWLDDGGPIFYRQTRVGLNGKHFDVIKFRSMRNDAEKDGVARWATKDDDRVTRIGRFIRKTRIDEIPQIFNVLTGDMSFVGPRPERPAIVADLEDKIAFFKYRHVVKPGITGWAQVNYPYGASIEDAREKLKYDLYYIKNESIFLDFLILMETVRVIFWPDGAR